MLFALDYGLGVQRPGTADIGGNRVLKQPADVGRLGLELDQGVGMGRGEGAQVRENVVAVAEQQGIRVFPGADAVAAIRVEAGSPVAPRDAPLPASPARVRPAWWIYLLAAVFLVDCLLRAYCRDFGPEGFGFGPRREDGRLVVDWLVPGGLADGAGMRVGDVSGP
jgi:hypothetical protein